MRNGFYAFTSKGDAIEARAEKVFMVKSAYDRERRCSKDNCMFGYEALCAGSEMAFTVEIDDDVEDRVYPMIEQALIGNKHLGRSRTAQYGLVSIKPCAFEEAGTCDKPVGELVTIYADGRLIFYNEDGFPTYQPTAQQLHLPEGSEIRWDLSQIRTFCYAPWNYKRQAYDTDRCGLEKGSVIVAKCPSAIACRDAYVGAYCNEGFGKVVYNPCFLNAKSDGRTTFAFREVARDVADCAQEKDLPHTPLMELLDARKKVEEQEYGIYESVNAFVEQYGSRFKNAAFASQWGTIRSIAMAHADEGKLMDELFKEPRGYLVHGTAKDKWAEKGRLSLLRDFCVNTSHGLLQRALVNLASEMAKTIKA